MRICINISAKIRRRGCFILANANMRSSTSRVRRSMSNERIQSRWNQTHKSIESILLLNDQRRDSRGWHFLVRSSLKHHYLISSSGRQMILHKTWINPKIIIIKRILLKDADREFSSKNNYKFIWWEELRNRILFCLVLLLFCIHYYCPTWWGTYESSNCWFCKWNAKGCIISETICQRQRVCL